MAGSPLSWRAGINALGLEPSQCVDWLPQWDDYTGAALFGTRFAAVLIDPRDALINWMVFGSAQAYQFPRSPEVAAGWLSQTFHAVANRLEHDADNTATAIRVDLIDTDAEAIGVQLQKALQLEVQPKTETLAEPILALGGLANQFPAGHWRHYRDEFAEAFALLTPVAVRLGYPAD
jgi:hypothetical protein